MSNDASSFEGKCITCGFAAKQGFQRIWPDANYPYFEIPHNERQNGISLEHGQTTCHIACFRGKVDLHGLSKDIIGKADLLGGVPQHIDDRMRELAAMYALNEAGCDSWYQYEPGRTPQEHLGDYQMQNLEEQRKAFELKLFQISQQVQADSLSAAKKSVRANWIIGAIVILLSLIQMAEVWYFSTRPPQPIIIQQQPSHQPTQSESSPSQR